MSRLTLSGSQVRQVLAALGVVASVAVLAVRGADGSDNIGVYDDTIYGVTPKKVVAYTGNTNPSRRREGVAQLIPGVYKMVPGIHGITTGRPRPAFRQPPGYDFTITRFGRSGKFIGWYAINLHDGSFSSTSSLGCITLPPDEFRKLVGQLYPALGWTAAKSQADPMGENAPEFPVVLQTADQIRAILASHSILKTQDLPQPGVRDVAIHLPGGKAFEGGKLVAGHVMVPIRAFTAQLARVAPEAAPITLAPDDADPDKLDEVKVAGKLLTEVAEGIGGDIKPRLWGWAPEIAAALGHPATWANGELTIGTTPRTEL